MKYEFIERERMPFLEVEKSISYRQEHCLTDNAKWCLKEIHNILHVPAIIKNLLPASQIIDA